MVSPCPGCRRAIADGEVGEGGGVEDYRRGLRRGFGHERGEAAAQVTALDAHPGRGREGQRAGEPAAAAVLVFGPDEGFEPCGGVGSCGVEGVEVDAGAPDDLRRLEVAWQAACGNAALCASPQAVRVPSRHRA
jgi:hypothetical protein